MRYLQHAWLSAGLIVAPWLRPATEQAVSIHLFQFEPKAIEVPAGTLVVWDNGDDIEHTVTSGNGEKADGRFTGTLDGKGTHFSMRFDQPGDYSYFCDRHYFMRGEIRVTPSGKAGN
jgi:plastocyanin